MLQIVSRPWHSRVAAETRFRVEVGTLTAAVLLLVFFLLMVLLLVVLLLVVVLQQLLRSDIL